MRRSTTVLILLLVFIISASNIVGCGKEPPPPPPPPPQRQPPPKPLNQLVPPEEKPRLAQNYPEQVYVEIFAQYDFLYDKNEGVRDAISEDLIKVMKKFGYNPKSSDDVEEVMNDLAKYLDDVINSDPKMGHPYLAKLNELIDKRIEQLWVQDSQNSE